MEFALLMLEAGSWSWAGAMGLELGYNMQVSRLGACLTDFSLRECMYYLLLHISTCMFYVGRGID